MVSVADHTQTALEMGAAGYAIKPVKREELVEALKRLETKFTQGCAASWWSRTTTCSARAPASSWPATTSRPSRSGRRPRRCEQLRAPTFDCMVLDLTLPDRSGFELLEEMSKTERYAFPPVIVYTGRSLSRDEEQQLRRSRTRSSSRARARRSACSTR